MLPLNTPILPLLLPRSWRKYFSWSKKYSSKETSNPWSALEPKDISLKNPSRDVVPICPTIKPYCIPQTTMVFAKGRGRGGEWSVGNTTAWQLHDNWCWPLVSTVNVWIQGTGLSFVFKIGNGHRFIVLGNFSVSMLGRCDAWCVTKPSLSEIWYTPKQSLHEVGSSKALWTNFLAIIYRSNPECWTGVFSWGCTWHTRRTQNLPRIAMRKITEVRSRARWSDGTDTGSMKWANLLLLHGSNIFHARLSTQCRVNQERRLNAKIDALSTKGAVLGKSGEGIPSEPWSRNITSAAVVMCVF